VSNSELSVTQSAEEGASSRASGSTWHPAGGGFVLRWVQPPWRDALRRRLLLVADVLACFAVGAVLAVVDQGTNRALVAVAVAPLSVVVAKLYGLYDRDHRMLRHLTTDELQSLFVWAITTVIGLALAIELVSDDELSTPGALALVVTLAVAALMLRSSARYLWRRIAPPERTLIVGQGELAAIAKRKLELFPDIHVTLVGDTEDVISDELVRDPSWLEGLDRVIVASESLEGEQIAAWLRACRSRGVKLSVVPPVRGLFGTAVQLTHVADLSVVEYNTWAVSPSTLVLKRAIDLSVAPLLLLLALPLFLLIAIVVKLEDRGPVFFSQLRAGRNGSPFRMFKFRTMRVDAEALLESIVSLGELDPPMFKFADDPRVTRIGRLLRRASLDELPQLWNVVRGDMSLVGPRPEQVELADRYALEHLFRLSVRPGLTGPMQVFGRGELTFEERLAVEREYIENLSIGRDLRILAITLAPVFTGRGAC
jgi:exopolysaccharide biosynthesis polyprenyl glycosylphosphotransferase